MTAARTGHGGNALLAVREAGDVRTLVLWSFYSPDAAALAEELKKIRELADGLT